MIINWQTETYKRIRRHFEDVIFAFPSTYDQEAIKKIISDHNGKLIELRPEPIAIREEVDFMGMNDRYAIQFDNEEDGLMFIMRFS